MAENDTLKRYLDAGLAFTQLTRSRAEGIVRDLVRAGELQREQAQDRVEELLERSRTNTDALITLVRKEIRDQLSQLGVRTGGARKAAARKGGSAKKTTARKAAAKKAPAKKAAAKTVKKAGTAAKKAGTAAKKKKAATASRTAAKKA